MNVLFLLGNGFDLQIGLNTKYKHFYDYYKEIQTDDNLVVAMKNNINDYLQGKQNDLANVNWEDLELALGQYTQVLKSYEELRRIYLDVNMNLREYLLGQQSQFEKTDQVLEKLKEDFRQPEKYLSINEKRRYRSLIDGTTGLHFLTFNYTNCCEVILDMMKPAVNGRGYATNIAKIQHIHGDLSMLNVVMGVNDEEQIENAIFKEDRRAKRMLIKPSTNDMLDNQKNLQIISLIKKMKVIVIYGASLGNSDKMWRDVLSDRLKSETCYFLINEYQDGFDNIYDQIEIEENAKVDFITKLGLGDEVEKYSKYVFVAVTRKLFSIDNIRNQ